MARLTWLAACSRFGGTSCGMVASFAGPQTTLQHSISRVATRIHHRLSTIGMLANNAARARSPAIRISLRSTRSEIQPAIGPRKSAGTTLRKSTAAIAKLASLYSDTPCPSTAPSWCALLFAIAVMASSPTHSPSAARPRPIQSRR